MTDPKMVAPQSRVYGTLDGMRGVAAIAVVLLHVPALFGQIRAPNAGLAVDMFFVMSGFIIAHAYEHRLRENLTWRRFAILRLIRLHTLYELGLLLGVTEATFNTLFVRSMGWV